MLDNMRLKMRTSLFEPTKNSLVVVPPLEPRRRVDPVEDVIAYVAVVEAIPDPSMEAVSVLVDNELE